MADKFDPFWEHIYIHLWVNVGEGITEVQLKEEFFEKVRKARDCAAIKRKQSIPSETDFQVYDLLTYAKKSRKEIFKEVWPEEFEKVFGGRSNSERDKHYKILQEKYRNQGIVDWDEAAYIEAYEVSNAGKSGPLSLYNKVYEGIKRVKRHMKWIKM